ncbi:MAG: carboxypeptidase regulatory-like domain-containing protein [Acidobacteria bacterium]|nr:carboxypeptidase regulatory-like domain-containing protein [Acidobacteriota bacterium]
MKLAFRLVFLSALLLGIALGQRADRATVTGVVTDPTGNSIAAATVKIRSDDTGVVTDLTTNAAGAYSSPSLVLGTYTITVEVSGFKTAVRPSIRLVGGQVFRQDVAMELGSVSEQVTVVASAEILNTASADVTHAVDANYYSNLPVVMGADIRLAEALLQLQPGYNPMKPNGDPMFRGSQFQSRLNGGQHSAMENFFDGVAFGYASGHNQSHESAPPIESVGEMKVITSAYSAQYGHSSGGTVEYSSRSGTKDLHGSFYEYFANDALNARGFFPDHASKQRSNAFGGTVGGPVYIPKVYDGRNKTFFFTNLDWLRFRAGVLPGFGNTTPVDAFKQGNFSALLTGRQVGTDAMGRAVLEGQIFNPSSTRLVNGVPVRDPFAGNMIPASMRSNVANKLTALMVQPDRAGLALNVAGNPAGDQTWIGDFRTIVFRVDHQWSEKFKTTTSFFWPKRPSIRNCGEVDGCNFKYDPRVSPDKNDTYIGNGFYQRIATQHATQQFDDVIKNNLLYHATVSWDRWFMGGTPISAGVNWLDKLWGTDRSGILDKTAGPPNMTFSGNIPYTQIGMQWIGFGFEAINRWQFANDLTWVKGKHSIKVGYEFRHHQFNFHGWAASTGGSFNFSRLGTGGYDANGNNLAATGDPFASFLLGQVQTANFTIPAFTTWNGNFTSTYLNDDYKVTSKLNVTLGMRFDYQMPWRERFDRFSTFDPSVPNPGAGGRLGALIFAGTGQGRTGGRTFDKIPVDALGPRFGLAYKANDKTVVRGGYGIYYAGVTFGQGGTPILGYQGNPTAPNLTNGLYPAFNLDDGFPRNLIKLPPFIDPTFSNGTAPVAYPADGLKQPRYQNWSLTFQRQIGQDMMIDVSYIGNKGTRLPHNPQFLGAGYNMNDPKVLALGTRVLQSDINSAEARAAGITPPYPGFTGIVAQALRPFPQYQAIEYRDVPIGKSRYNSLQITLDKRFSNGLQFRTFYVWAQLYNNRAESGQRGGAGVQNPINTQAGEWALSADDVPNAFVFSGTYALPFGRNMTGFMGKVLKGWTLNGILRYDSGRPQLISMNNDLAGLLFNTTKRPNRIDGTAGIGEFQGKFDPNRDRYFNRAGWADPGPLQFGNALSRDGTVRGFRNKVEDISLFKVTSINERFKWRLEAQAGNVTNRVIFCDPNTNFSAAQFGQTGTQCNQPRSIQFGMKLEY